MRIYSEPVEMIKEVERDLFEMGTRYQTSTVQDQKVKNNPDFLTIELFGYAYTLTNTVDENGLINMLKYMNTNLGWIGVESLERLSLSNPDKNPGFAWVANQELWRPFLRNDCFSYSYAERWSEQIPYVIRELKRNPNSRQAIITMYDRHQDMMNWGGLDRVPCSVSYQFLLRDDKLTVIYNQRSCDFMTFFAADVYFTIHLLNFIAEAVGVVPGSFIHFLGSLHAFAKDLEGRNIF
jgi:thymidylate synthase